MKIKLNRLNSVSKLTERKSISLKTSLNEIILYFEDIKVDKSYDLRLEYIYSRISMKI